LTDRGKTQHIQRKVILVQCEVDYSWWMFDPRSIRELEATE